jgi:DNA-binding beta-propeller fold protein YncE
VLYEKFNPISGLTSISRPRSTKFSGNGKGNYTVWTPYGINKTMADDSTDDTDWRIQVDRFTKIDNDPIANAIYDAIGIRFTSLPISPEKIMEALTQQKTTQFQK